MNNTNNYGEHPEKDAPGAVPEISPADPIQERTLDRAAAFDILGLKETANAYAVDNRFWQLTKRYRAEKNDEKLKAVTEAYEIASGRAAQKQVELTTEEHSKKFFGKSIRQWKVYLYYTWWKILVFVICIAVGGALVYQMITGGNYGIKVVSIGHFYMDNTYLTDYTEDELGYSKPYITYADLVVDGSEAESNATVYGAASAAAFLGINPDVIIFDAKTMPYYLGIIVDMDSYYKSLQETLPKVLLDKIEPVTCTLRQYKELIAEEDEKIDLSPDDEVEHIYGLKISDPELINALGYFNEWTSQDASLVFSISATSTDMTKAQDFITAIMRNQNVILEAYRTSAEATAAASDPVESDASELTPVTAVTAS